MNSNYRSSLGIFHASVRMKLIAPIQWGPNELKKLNVKATKKSKHQEPIYLAVIQVMGKFSYRKKNNNSYLKKIKIEYNVTMCEIIV